jgi:hypothetical protein
MRRKMEQIQLETSEFVEYVKQELVRANREGWQQRFEQALVKLPPRPPAPRPNAAAAEPEQPAEAPDHKPR